MTKSSITLHYSILCYILNIGKEVYHINIFDNNDHRGANKIIPI